MADVNLRATPLLQPIRHAATPSVNASVKESRPRSCIKNKTPAWNMQWFCGLFTRHNTQEPLKWWRGKINPHWEMIRRVQSNEATQLYLERILKMIRPRSVRRRQNLSGVCSYVRVCGCSLDLPDWTKVIIIGLDWNYQDISNCAV